MDCYSVMIYATVTQYIDSLNCASIARKSDFYHRYNEKFSDCSTRLIKFLWYLNKEVTFKLGLVNIQIVTCHLHYCN